MAWNNDNGSDNKNPWGNRGQQAPPDLEKIIRDFFKKLGISFSSGGPSVTGSSKNSFSFIVGVIAALAVLIWAACGFTVVNPSEQAVVLQFGKYTTTLNPGIHWRPPLIDSVYKVNVNQIRTFSYPERKDNILTKGENIVSLEFIVQYNVDSGRLQDYLFNVVDPDGSLRQAMASATRQVIGSSDFNDIVTTNRAEITKEVQAKLENILAQYNTGIHVIAVTMQSAQAPEEVSAAFADVVKAREDQKTYQNQAKTYANNKVPAAQGEAQRLIIAANAYKEQVQNNALATVAKYTAIRDVYKQHKDITMERMYLDAFDQIYSNASKVLVDLKNQNNLIYLPLDKLVSEVKAAQTKPSVVTQSQEN